MPRLHASGEKVRDKFVVTNNQELAEKHLKSEGFDHIVFASDQLGDYHEIMYFDESGQIVPNERLRATNNYK